MVGDSLTRTLVFRVVLGVGGAAVASGSCTRPSYSYDGWVCDLGTVDTSLIFGLVRGTGFFVVVIPTLVLVSRIQFVQRYRDNVTSFSVVSIFRCSSPPDNLLYGRRVDPSTLSFSLSSHRHSSHTHIRLLYNSLFIGS